MKIYPSIHNVIKTNKVDHRKHIALSYIGAPRNNQINIKFNLLNKYKKDEVVELKPYQIIKNNKTIIFKEDMTIEDNNKILKDIDNGLFYYIPPSINTESPDSFKYNILYKSNKEYNKIDLYNIKVGFVDNTKNAEKSKKLISIFGDSNTRGLSASNVIINNKDLSPSSLINREMKDNDILIIETDDGEHYKGTTKKIDYQYFKDNKINIWLVAGEKFDCEYGKIEKKENSKSRIKTNISFANEEYVSDFIFNQIKGQDKKIEGDNSLVFSHDLNNNMVIITAFDFFNNLNKNAKAIHEILLYSYLNQYHISSDLFSWVHNYIPDYEFINNKIVKIDKFKEEIKEIEGLEPIKAIIQRDNISYEINNRDIIFEKENNENYIKKESNNITIMDHNKNIITVNKNLKHYLVKQSPKIKSYTYKNNHLEIIFSGIINSNESIYIPNDYKYREEIDMNKINSKKMFYTVGNNVIDIVGDPSNNDNIGVIIIDIYNESSIEAFDLRSKGGGLTKDRENNYNLLDIGSSNGRPIRKSGSMTIRLPKELEEHQEKIREYIDNHKIADRHYILIFEERR